MNIPKHWQIVPLKELVIIQKGDKPTKLKVKSFSDSLPYLDVETVESGRIRQFADAYSSTVSTENDIFVLRTGGRNGLILRGKQGAVGSTLICLTPIVIDKDYLYYFLKLNEFQHSGIRDIINTFWDMQVPVPPLEEQKRIVKELETKLQAFQKDFENAENELLKLEEYRRSILDDAISGKLTEEWREENNVKNEYKIVLNREIPIQWDLTKLDTIIEKIEAGRSFRCEERIPNFDEVGVLKVSAVSWGKYIENESKTCVNSKFINPNYFVIQDDFLISRSNTVELVGACVIAENVTKKIMLSDKILRIVFKETYSKFILYTLRSRFGRLQIERFATGSQESMKNITQNNIKEITILLPPYIEQIEIVNQLEKLLTQTNKIEQEYHESILQTKNLQQSILQMAFNGQLNTYDPKDETVTDLLERLKAEKERLEKERKLFKEKQKIGKKQMKPKELSKNDIEQAITEEFGNQAFESLKLQRFLQNKFDEESFEYDKFKNEIIKLLQEPLIIVQNQAFLEQVFDKHTGKLLLKIKSL